jgi:hypothetical protein
VSEGTLAEDGRYARIRRASSFETSSFQVPDAAFSFGANFPSTSLPTKSLV